jgi:hypothetical protein
MGGAGASRAHRDINGRRRSVRAGGSCRQRSRINTGAAVDRIRDSELVTLRVDYVDICSVDGADLVAPFGVGSAGDLDRVKQIRRRDICSERNIRWRPRHKVPKIETEVGGIGINAGPFNGNGGPGCVGRVGRRTGDLDGGHQRTEREDQGDRRENHLDFRIPSIDFFFAKNGIFQLS